MWFTVCFVCSFSRLAITVCMWFTVCTSSSSTYPKGVLRMPHWVLIVGTSSFIVLTDSVGDEAVLWDCVDVLSLLLDFSTLSLVARDWLIALSLKDEGSAYLAASLIHSSWFNSNPSTPASQPPSFLHVDWSQLYTVISEWIDSVSVGVQVLTG